MRVGAGNVGYLGRGLTLAVLAAGLVAGCATEGGRPDAASTASAKATAKVAQRGGSVGAKGSACELPVTFDIAEFWKAKAVDAGKASNAGGDLADLADALLHQGPVTMACEIDAKPAGKIGFLRVWTGEPGDTDARATLEGFVAAEKEASGAKYSTFTSGAVTGAEVEYVVTSKLLDEPRTEHALAVTTSEGPVVLHLGGLDDGEHTAMLPAYELAKSTLRTTAA